MEEEDALAVGDRLGSFVTECWEDWVEEVVEGAVKYKPEWEDSEEGFLVAGSRRLCFLWTPGGGGGLKGGGESVPDCTSSLE